MPIHDDLARFIYNERVTPNEQGDRWLFLHEGLKSGEPDYDEFAERYKDVGLKVLELALITYNRFITFARNAKGQYWLYERPYKPAKLNQDNNKFRAQFKLGDHDWFLWRPPTIDQFMVAKGDKKEAIKREDWSSFQDFVSSSQKLDFVQELFANSELFLAEGRRRSAVIEAVSAFEITIFRFADSPNITSFTPEQRERFDLKHFRSQIHKLGLGGTTRLLLPLLFSPEQFPTKILNDCQEALTTRNNVVHNGKRDVEAAKAYMFVHSIKEACHILASVTASSV